MNKSLALLLILVNLTKADCPNWDTQQAQQNIEQLQQQIDYYNKNYFSDKQVNISDTVYDELVNKLQNWQECFSIKSTNNKILDTVNNSNQSIITKHNKFMGSLAKTNLNKINLFLNKSSDNICIIQPKIDGIAVELMYINGVLTKALTRGDGNLGMNITHHVASMPNIPQSLANWSANIDDKIIVLHGELFLRMDLIPKKILNQYSTPRQFVSSLVMRKHGSKKFSEWVDFFPWDWVNSNQKTDLDSIWQLYKYGYSLPKKFTDITDNTAKIESIYKYYQQKNKLPFTTDGVVIKINNYKIRNKFGRTKLTPHWAVAVKFLSPSTTAEVTDIKYSIGRTGKITPVLKLIPVKIENRFITSISIGSVKNLQQLDIAINDIISLHIKGNALAVFDKVLFRPTTRIKKDVKSQKNYDQFSCLSYCELCDSQFKARLLWLTGKKGFNITTITPKILDQLIADKTITALVDILKLYELSLINNLPSFKKLLAALVIPHINEKKLDLLMQKITNVQELTTLDSQQLSALIKISSKHAIDITNYIKQPEIYAVLHWYAEKIKNNFEVKL